jgi:hypothetical protein
MYIFLLITEHTTAIPQLKIILSKFMEIVCNENWSNWKGNNAKGKLRREMFKAEGLSVNWLLGQTV